MVWKGWRGGIVTTGTVGSQSNEWARGLGVHGAGACKSQNGMLNEGESQW